MKYALVLVAIMVFLTAAYALRLVLKGPVHFDRVESQGGSVLLGKSIMVFGYWILQPVARLLILLRVTPNQLTWASFGCGFLAGAFLATGRFGFSAILAAISGLLDCLDGMVARISGVACDAGEVLDAAIDRYVEFFFLSGLVIYYRDVAGLQVLALLALLGSFMVSYSTTKAEALNLLVPPRGLMRRPERAVYLTLGAALSALTIPSLETRWPSPLSIGYPMVAALVLVAIAANLSAVERFWFLAKAARLRDQNPEKADARTSENIVSQEQQPSQARPVNI